MSTPLIYDSSERTKLLKMIHELDSRKHYDEPHMMHHDSMHTQRKYILSGQNDMMALNNADDSRVTMSMACNHCARVGGGRVASGGRLSGGRLSGGGRVASGGRLSGGGRVASGGRLSGGQLKRGNLVKEVMKKYGLNLGQASKYIKENSL